MSLGIPGTSMEASAGGFGRVSCVTALPFFASSPLPADFLLLDAFGKFSFLGLATVLEDPPASRRPTPAAASPATAAPPPSRRKPPRPTDNAPSGPASRDLIAGEAALPGAPACIASPA